jgi:hypothetical protein
MRTLNELVCALGLQFLSTLYKAYVVESAVDIAGWLFSAIGFPSFLCCFKKRGKAAKFREKPALNC